MSVTLLTAPPALSFSADLISAKFACTGYLQQVGVKSVNKLSIPLTVTDGTQTQIRYGNTTVTMTAKLLPDDSGNQFLAYGGPLSPSAQIFAINFRTNYQLSRDFDITYVGDDLFFTAKTKSLGFDFKNSPGEGTNTVSGLPAIKQPNYTVLFKLFLENEANTAYDLIYTTNLQLLPGTDGQAEAMIGDKLHAVISKAIRATLPEQPSENVIQCKNSCRRYYFEFAESYGEPITVKKLNTSGVYTALHGGLSTIAQSQTSALNLLAPTTAENDRFLKQGAKTILTRTNQPQFLYFFNSRLGKTVSVKSIFTFTDGTVHAETIAGISLESYRKYAFDASFEFLYANPVSSKIVASYTVYLINGADRVSEIRTFVLDYSRRNQIRYFLNWSSFGAIDTRLCYGKGESEFDLSSNTAERIPGVGENIMFGKSLTFDSTLKRSFKVATGFIGRQELQHNADFFLSNLKYRFSKNLNLPITITSGKIAEVKDGDLLLAQVFEYSYNFADHAYTEGDAEDTGFGMDGFYFNSGGGFIPSPGGGGSGGSGGAETDPTVGAWIKAITPADIARWNATVGITFGNWIDVDAIASQINYQALRLQYKTDAPSDANKAITYIAGYFNLDPAFVGASLLIGKLPDGNRPLTTLKEWFVVGTTEMFLVIDSNGDIRIDSKDGFNLPTGATDEVKYFINLNYKPKTSLVIRAGKWVVDATGTSCEPGNTGYQINTLLKLATDDALQLPLDINYHLCTTSGLAQATKATDVADPLYRTYNPTDCAIAPGKWIIDTATWRCDPANPGYRIFERMLRVADNVGQAPYDVNDKLCSATGLPQATAPTPTDQAGYKELNTALCPIAGKPVTVNYNIDYASNPFVWMGFIPMRNGAEVDRILSATSGTITGVYVEGDEIGFRQVTFPLIFPWVPGTGAFLEVKRNGALYLQNSVYLQTTELQNPTFIIPIGTTVFDVKMLGLNAGVSGWLTHTLVTVGADMIVEVKDIVSSELYINVTPQSGSSTFNMNQRDNSDPNTVSITNLGVTSATYRVQGVLSYDQNILVGANLTGTLTDVPKGSITITKL